MTTVSVYYGSRCCGQRGEEIYSLLSLSVALMAVFPLCLYDSRQSKIPFVH